MSVNIRSLCEYIEFKSHQVLVLVAHIWLYFHIFRYNNNNYYYYYNLTTFLCRKIDFDNTKRISMEQFFEKVD